MKTLTLNDGTQFEVNEDSSLFQITMTTNTETMKDAVEKITTENLKHATLSGTSFVNARVNNISVSTPDSETGEVYIIFYIGEKSDMEIVQERLEEQDAALMELAELIVG